MCGQCLDKDAPVIGRIVIFHDDFAATVTYYHNVILLLLCYSVFTIVICLSRIDNLQNYYFFLLGDDFWGVF